MESKRRRIDDPDRGLGDLSDEVLLRVFRYLGGLDLIRCMLVCRQWRDAAKDKSLWAAVVRREWRDPPPPFAVKDVGDWFSVYHYWHRTRTSFPTGDRPLLIGSVEIDIDVGTAYVTATYEVDQPRLIHSVQLVFPRTWRLLPSTCIRYGCNAGTPERPLFHMPVWTRFFGSAETRREQFTGCASALSKPLCPVVATAFRIDVEVSMTERHNRRDLERMMDPSNVTVFYTPINHYHVVRDAVRASWNKLVLPTPG